MQRFIEWNWYGTWVLDYLCTEDPWLAFDFWMKAYLEAHPDLDDAYQHGEINTVDLIEYYPGATDCVRASLLYQLMVPLIEFWAWVYWVLRLGQLRWWLMEGADEGIEAPW